MERTKEQLKEIYRVLPEDIKEAMFAVDTSEAIQNVCKAFGLHIDQMGELADEVGRVMLGLTSPKDFIGNIEKRLNISEVKAKQITRDVNENIFVKIRDSLKKIHKEKYSDDFSPEDEDDLSRDGILKRIENPSSPVPKKEAVFEEKVEPLLRVPKKEVTVDPYREPVE